MNIKINRRTFGLLTTSALVTAGCSSKFRSYNGPEVTSIVVNKGSRQMYLLHHEEILKEYQFALGFAPNGDKKVKGDGKTPEGTYLIDRRNPNSAFHLSLGISYPNAKDVAEARALGESPGGDIFIHGQPNLFADRREAKKRGSDWTAGCIAVKNREIEEMYAMVQVGTLITLRA